MAKSKSGSQPAATRRSDFVKARQRPELHHELGEDQASEIATAEAIAAKRGSAEETASSPSVADGLADKENMEQEQPAESKDVHADINVNAAPVRPKRHSWAFSVPQAAGSPEPSEALSSKANGHFQQQLQLWGKREANGFAGKPMSKDSKCRLSKAEAEATLQRLINAGTKVDFDEVRRLRKLINEAGG